jgi:hypothetical protein
VSTFQFPASRAGALTQALHEAGFRSPSSTDGTPRSITLTYEPDLSPEEQATFDLVSRLAVGAALITPEERTRIQPDIQSLRDLRQLGRNAFMALTAAERDRLLYDAQTATTIVLLALLRD